MLNAALSRQVVISDHNEGPVVNIAAWLGMTIMILCVCARIGSKYGVLRKWSVDDGVILITMVLAATHTLILSLMVSTGLGQPQQSLANDQIEDFQEYAYTSQLLYIPVLCLAKLSTLIYLRALSPETPYGLLNQIIEFIVIIWGISAEFGIAFQCSMPNPWSILSNQCFDRISFWNVIGIFDILTDLAIISVPVCLVWGIRMSRSKKVFVFLIFSNRIFVTPLTILRMYYLNTVSSPNLADQTLTSYHAYFATTLQLNIAIVVACIPFLKPFMEAMSTGAFASTLAPMDNSYGPSSKLNTFVSGYSSWRASNPKKSFKMDFINEITVFSENKKPHLSANSPDTSHSTSNTDGEFHFGFTGSQSNLVALRPDYPTHFNHIGRATPAGGSQRSSLGSDRMIIKRTTDWKVEEMYEYFIPGEEPAGLSKYQGNKTDPVSLNKDSPSKEVYCSV